MYASNDVVILRDRTRRDRFLRSPGPSRSPRPSRSPGGPGSRGSPGAFVDEPVLRRFEREGVIALPDEPPEPAVSVERADRAVVRDALADETVVAVAEAMPVSLVRHVAADLLGASEAASGDPLADARREGVTWGLRACGADRALVDGAGTTVAVLDTGIDADHEAFADTNLQIVRRNFTQEGDDDTDGHGTHCAGTIFGRPVEGVRIGVAPGLRKALVAKVIGAGGSSGALVRAMNWAVDEGADVISMSLAFDFVRLQRDLAAQGVPAPAATSMALHAFRNNVRLFDEWMALNAARAQFGQGAVVVAAAGNESRRGAATPFEIATASPAAGIGVVSVGALARGDAGLAVASFSNTGPRVSGPGVGVVSARAGGGLLALNGTSMACPHVAGIAALVIDDLRGAHRPVRPDRVAAELIAKARTDALAPGIDFTDVGSGIAQAP